jgi:transcriptional regulator with XRE-family HTH domain
MATTPSPNEIRAAREQAGLTQAQAAELIGITRLSWARYETKAANSRKMPDNLWKLFKHLAGIERIPFRSHPQ